MHSDWSEQQNLAGQWTFSEIAVCLTNLMYLPRFKKLG